MKLLMGTKPQFKMYLEPEMIERLKQAAARFNRDSGQDIVEEIVSIYLPAWIAVNDSMRRAVEYHIKQIAQKGERSVDATIQPKGFKVPPTGPGPKRWPLENQDEVEKRRDKSVPTKKKKRLA